MNTLTSVLEITNDPRYDVDHASIEFGLSNYFAVHHLEQGRDLSPEQEERVVHDVVGIIEFVQNQIEDEERDFETDEELRGWIDDYIRLTSAVIRLFGVKYRQQSPRIMGCCRKISRETEAGLL